MCHQFQACLHMVSSSMFPRCFRACLTLCIPTISYVSMSDSSPSENKPKLAILNYEKAMTEMKKRNQKGAYKERLEQIAAIINELKIEAGQSVEEESEEANELTQAMNELIEEEDAWKKKYF